MGHIFIILLSTLSISLSNTTQNIEKAFLQNNPRILLSLFPSDFTINVSLPDPISFSDNISNQQAFFLFKKIFSTYSTFEFYPDRKSLENPESSFIFKASWSFRDRRDATQYVYHIFFYMTLMVHPDSTSKPVSWIITEIRVE